MTIAVATPLVARMTKAELARELGVSRSYITMIDQGKRTPSRKLTRKLKRLTGEANHLTFNQGVVGSNPSRPTKAT
jgi:DNA-binding XRE family transcriptional regulator